MLANGANHAFRSRLERDYANYLYGLQLAGEIQSYAYEAVRLQLAPKTTLTPDFLVVTKGGQVEFHETKGWAREDAMVKLKVAARLFPSWRFVLVTRVRREWRMKEVPA